MFPKSFHNIYGLVVEHVAVPIERTVCFGCYICCRKYNWKMQKRVLMKDKGCYFLPLLII